MASPYHQSLNLAKQDHSAIGRSGEAIGRMYAQMGDAIAKVGSAYFEEQGFKEKAKEWAGTQQGRAYLKNQGIDYDGDPAKSEKLIKGLIREQGGFKEFKKNLQEEQMLKTQQEVATQNAYFMEEKRSEQEAQKKHYNTVNKMIPNPSLDSHKKSLTESRNKLLKLGEDVTSGKISDKQYSSSSYFIGDEIKKTKKSMEGIDEQVPMYELDPDKFNEAYGETSDPYQQKYKMEHMMNLQKRADTKSSDSVEKATKLLAYNNLVDEEKAEQGFNNFVGGKPYVFDEADRNKQVLEFQSKNKLQFSKDQRESLAQSIRYINPKDLIAQKDSLYKRDELDGDDKVISSAQELTNLLQLENPIADTASIEKFARILQPQGMLTEDDITRVSGSKALYDRFERAYEEIKNGTLSDSAKKDLREASDELLTLASERKFAGVERMIGELSSSYDVAPEDIRKRFFSTDMDNVPKKALSRLNGESDEVQEVSINGKREQVKVVKTFPDGRKVVEINGEQKIIDPR